MSHGHEPPPNPPLSVVAVIRRDGRVLLGCRSPEVVRPGLWSLPGGFVEVDEHPEDALAREVAEETGLSITSATLRSADLDRSDPDKTVVVLTYDVEADGEAVAGDDFLEVGWFGSGALPELAFAADLGRTQSSGTSQPGPGGS